VSLGVLALPWGQSTAVTGIKVTDLGGDGDIAEAFLLLKILEGSDHVGLEVVPAQAELLIVRHLGSFAAALQGIHIVSTF
jgi:hypothetical protein